ncbi:MAG: hypothetical protein U0271_33695 [Polyangiaceae bacterium]
MRYASIGAVLLSLLAAACGDERGARPEPARETASAPSETHSETALGGPNPAASGAARASASASEPMCTNLIDSTPNPALRRVHVVGYAIESGGVTEFALEPILDGPTFTVRAPADLAPYLMEAFSRGRVVEVGADAPRANCAPLVRVVRAFDAEAHGAPPVWMTR